jgi:hypothetical protein
MTKRVWNLLKLTPAIVAATFFYTSSALAQVNQSVSPANQQISSEADLTQSTADIGQVTSVSQFSDVQPTDWAFQALQSLVERYGCIAGYPNGTYRGNRALTRYEFAAGLNACLDRVNELIATATAEIISKGDLATLARLQEEFAAELATLRGRVDALEARTAELEANQFSTTTKLTGEVIFAIADVFGEERTFPFGIDEGIVEDELNFAGLRDGDEEVIQQTAATLIERGFDVGGDNPQERLAELIEAYGAENFADSLERREIEGNTVFAYRARLNFDASFFGNDRLRVRLQARNISPFNIGRTGTDMTRLGFDGDEDGSFEIDDLYYRFNLGNALRVTLAAGETEYNDAFEVFNPAFESSGSGAISRFGRFSPIYRSGDGAGIMVTFGPNSPISASVGYLAPDADDPGLGNGLFSGSYAAVGQIAFKPSPAFNIGLTYARTYYNSEAGVDLFGSTGSFLANSPFGNTATTANHYGVQLVFRPSSSITLSGWGGYSTAFAEVDEGLFEDADAEMLHWAGAVAIQDLGREGNTLGVIFGQPPRVIESDVIEDRDTTYHLEALYKLRLTDNILITPGVLVLFNPEHNDDNDNIYVGTIRATFSF